MAVNSKMITGELSLHHEGYGFVSPQEEGLSDIFIPARSIGDALHGDIVEVKIYKGRKGLFEGKVVAVVERYLKQLVGRLERHDREWVFISEDRRVRHLMRLTSVPPADCGHLDTVVVQIVRYPSGKKPGLVQVLEKLPERGTLSAEVEYVIAKHQLIRSFPKDVLTEACKIKNEAAKGRGQTTNRKDLRELPFVTIDGEDAKDFDDAVCAQLLEAGHIRFWVAIADVCHFVSPNSLLDQEAYSRGTSVYFPGRVLPMLPEILSNDLCSLRPNEERLVLVAELVIDRSGALLKEDFYPAIIESKARLTYHRVHSLLEEGKVEGLEPLLPILENLSEVAGRLHRLRNHRGSLNFDLPEPQIILDFTGGIEDIERSKRLWSHQIIEELMIAANESVARFLKSKRCGCIYRIHEKPNPEKIKHFYKVIQRLGYKGKFPSIITPKEMGKILTFFSGHPEERFVNTMLLRSLSQAIYSSQNKGHFGLASRCYCHFTSPIRRYPDLMVHQILKNVFVNNQLTPKARKLFKERLIEIADHSSRQERRALGGEREILSLHNAIFMEDKIGKVFEGVISHVAKFGFFVELIDFFVEGLVERKTLKGNDYTFDKDQFCLRGKKRGEIFGVGKRVAIQVESVNIPERQVIFKFLSTL